MFSTGSLLHSRFDDIKNGSVETYTIVYSTGKLHFPYPKGPGHRDVSISGIS